MAAEKSTMRFLFGDRELLLAVTDLLLAPVEVIVNPADHALQHQFGLARQIQQRAGGQLQQESEQLIREYGQIDSGMAVYTSAGELPFKAIIHAVGPVMGEGDEQRKLEQAVSRSLQLCDMNEWRSIAIPVVSEGESALPVEVCAQAFFRAITRFWDARHECALEMVLVSLQQAQFQAFFAAFREQGFTEEEDIGQLSQTDVDERVGEVALSETDIEDLDDPNISDWFK